MHYRFNPYKIYIALFLILCAYFADAQEGKVNNTPAGLELLNRNSLWNSSGNAAGLQFDHPYQYSVLSAGYEFYDGNFRRPQEGKSRNRQRLSTEGNLFVKGYYLSGQFNYSRDNIKGANFNSSIIDPFRGMPYIIADLNPSDWNNQHYDLQFKIATPNFNDKWSFGLEGKYTVANGAKQRDIRAQNTYYALDIAPAVVYSPAKNHHIGLNLKYSNVKEESAMSNVNTYIDQPYYELLGLGTAVGYLGSGRTNNYKGDAVGAELQYHYEGDIAIFFNAAYKAEAEDLQISFTVPRDGGSVLRHVWNSRLAFKKEGQRFSHLLNLTYYNRSMDGIQYITQRDNSADQQGWVTLLKNVRSTYSIQNAGAAYNLITKPGNSNEYSWKVDAGVSYEKLKDEYLLPNTLKQVENLLFTVGAKKNFVLSDLKSKRLLVGAELGYKNNLSGSYNYNGAHPEYAIVTDLEQNDFNYLSADYISAGIPLVYSQQLKENSKTNLFAKANFQYIHTNSFAYKERHMASFTFGCNF